MTCEYGSDLQFLRLDCWLGAGSLPVFLTAVVGPKPMRGTPAEDTGWARVFARQRSALPSGPKDTRASQSGCLTLFRCPSHLAA